MLKDYNHEVKCMGDLEHRYANIHCHGSYGINPNVTMITRESTIHEGFIKKVDIQFIGKDENGENQFNRTLYIDSEYGHEIKLPYEKIIGMTILSSKDQATVERYNQMKDYWEKEIARLNDMLSETDKDNNKELYHALSETIDAFEFSLERGRKLIESGVKTYK